MITRVLTSVVGIPFVILLMAIGSPYLELSACVVALIGIYEFYHMMNQKYNTIPWIGYIMAIIYILFLGYFVNQFLMYMTILVLSGLVTMVIFHPKYSIADICITLFAPIYVAVFLGFIVLIRRMDYGVFLVWLIFVSAWGSDTCAYFAGSMFGKHKLAPLLSPKKTVEGAIGGALGAVVIAYIYITVCNYFKDIELFVNHSVQLLIIVFFAAIISQIGDLAASSIKRNIGAKDFGNIFPGHGGVLDRFDSILFVAPFIYFMLQIIG
ncbi:MAG: phosphatidate cytidylyltransferase [Cellulosilyticaceae bacterium]